MLFEDSHYQMKEKDRPNFSLNDQFGDIIINSQYIIQKAKIFYISNTNDADKQTGILDMENLLTEYQNENPNKKIKFIQGPIEINSANEFMIIYRISNKNLTKQHVNVTQTSLGNGLQPIDEDKEFLIDTAENQDDKRDEFKIKIYKKPEVKQ